MNPSPVVAQRFLFYYGAADRYIGVAEAAANIAGRHR